MGELKSIANNDSLSFLGRFELVVAFHSMDYVKSNVPRVEGLAWLHIEKCMEMATRVYQGEVPNSDFLGYLDLIELLLEESLKPGKCPG